MRFEARIAAAIEVLDLIGGGVAAEKALTNWGRTHRFAGSGDRRAIRDLVFDALRQRASLAALGGGTTGRALMIGALRQVQADDLSKVFSGEGHAPPPLTAEESAFEPAPRETLPRHLRLDYPEWLEPELTRSLGDTLDAVMERMRTRAPVFLRVNTGKGTREEAQAALARDEIETAPYELAETALLVTHKHQKLRQSQAFLAGLVELQDAASQAVVQYLGVPGPGVRVLDYCAGGGGKALALAVGGADIVAHDADPGRMSDLPARAARAGVTIARAETAALDGAARFDLVLADAPCSGSGAWRRQPAAKWELSQARLDAVLAVQAEILDQAARLVAPDGRLAYATCSLLRCENADQIEAFRTRHPEWALIGERQITPLDGGDGFYIAQLTRVS
ncbi:MAG: RsmB/NOP family class I SAM-dependent RNA methyltransferase [Rhodobacteraceae bacterium]|nr:RsmB/NOP family class I SAM-dependent RNA methyltransferase [Paracoccaceae bacterium]